MDAIEKIKNEAVIRFGTNAQFLVSRAPGRVNLIGEHTDYNLGLVLPGAITKSLYFAFKPNGTNHINVHAMDFGQSHSIDLDNLKHTQISWVDYMTGILIECRSRHIVLKGFDCLIASDIPIGAGLSSSAAFDCAFIMGLNSMLDCKFTDWDIVNISNTSNNNFLGIKSGILDQFASVFGREGKVMFMDCDTRQFDYVDLPETKYTWLLIDTCVKHSHLTSAYNKRVEECNGALQSIKRRLPEVRHLSDIENMGVIDDVQFNTSKESARARFIIEENRRVRLFAEALQKSDMMACGNLLHASHEGLSGKYEVSCPELDFLVSEAMGMESVLGARMMGGGFGGCTLNLLNREYLPYLMNRIAKSYKNRFGLEPKFYDVKMGGQADVRYYSTA